MIAWLVVGVKDCDMVGTLLKLAVGFSFSLGKIVQYRTYSSHSQLDSCQVFTKGFKTFQEVYQEIQEISRLVFFCNEKDRFL